MKMRFILLFYALVIHGDKKLIINESLGFVIRQITPAVRSSVGVDMPITLSLKKNIPDGVNTRDDCNGKTKVKVINENSDMPHMAFE